MTAAELADWEATWFEAHIWQCGGIFRSMDDECDCRQPVVDCVTPDRGAGYPRVNRRRVWSGTFHSDAEPDELAAQRAELKAVVYRYGITLNAEHYGRQQRVADSVCLDLSASE